MTSTQCLEGLTNESVEPIKGKLAGQCARKAAMYMLLATCNLEKKGFLAVTLPKRMVCFDKAEPSLHYSLAAQQTMNQPVDLRATRCGFKIFYAFKFYFFFSFCNFYNP